MPAISEAKVLIIATDGFEEAELMVPRDTLAQAGATVSLASIKTDPIQGMEKDVEKAGKITPDLTIADVDPADYHALVIPGGTTNPDTMRLEADAIRIVRGFFDAGKPVAAICHGPWLLAEADVVKGRTVTSWPSVRTDLRNAGAEVVDKEVQVDGNLITSRKPEDLDAFSHAIIQAIEAA